MEKHFTVTTNTVCLLNFIQIDNLSLTLTKVFCKPNYTQVSGVKLRSAFDSHSHYSLHLPSTPVTPWLHAFVSFSFELTNVLDVHTVPKSV